MILKLHNITSALLLALATVMALVSCRSDEEVRIEPEQHPIAFASVTAAEEQETRASVPLARDFVVYAYKRVADGTEQEVIHGYTVKYKEGSANTSSDNTHGYYYVYDDQMLKYWDFGATEYHFWGASVSPDYEGGEVTFTGEKHNTLTIPDIPLRVGEPAPADDVLFSALTVRCPVSTDVVRMIFKRPYAIVRIQFYSSEPIDGEMTLTQITFSPDPYATSPLVNKVYGQGNVVVTYPSAIDNCAGKGQEAVTVESLAEPQEALLFDAVTLTPTLGISSNTAVTAPIDETEGFRLSDMAGASLKARPTRAGEVPGKKYYYYPLPMGELNPAFTMQANINGEMKTAVVPAAFMQWKPNFLYTYIFKITEAGKSLALFDVQIDPWQYGGTQEEKWRNW